MKKIISLLLVIMITVSSVGTAFAASNAHVQYGVNFRKAPGTDSQIIRMLSKGEKIEVIEQVNDYWLKVRVNGQIGYVSANSKYTDYAAGNSDKETERPLVKTTAYPYLRSAPSVNNSKIYRTVPKGTTLEVLGQPNASYIKVNYNGQVGYISTLYIEYTNDNQSAAAKADAIIETAKSLMNRATYQYGVRNHSKLIFDCSSFTEYVFEKHGIDMKWGTRFQKYIGRYVSKSNLKKGDLVFFTVGNSKEIGHVGIYIENGDFIHILTQEGSDVHIANLRSGYWNDHYVTARRVLDW